MSNDTPQKSSISGFVYQALAGIALGLLLAAFIGPTMISWWYKPPSGNAFSCADTVKEALSKFVTLELVCGAFGGVDVLVVTFLVRGFWRRRKAARGAAA